MRYLVGRYDVSTRRACGVIKATRSSAYYRSRKDPLIALRQRLRELAQTRVRFGYRRLRVLLLREGWSVGKERFYRVYTEEGLALRRKRHGPPLRRYYGTEFVSAAMDLWAYTYGVILDFSRRGKPTDNATIESFNGRFREECLNVRITRGCAAQNRRVSVGLQ